MVYQPDINPLHDVAVAAIWVSALPVCVYVCACVSSTKHSCAPCTPSPKQTPSISLHKWEPDQASWPTARGSRCRLVRPNRRPRQPDDTVTRTYAQTAAGARHAKTRSRFTTGLSYQRADRQDARWAAGLSMQNSEYTESCGCVIIPNRWGCFWKISEMQINEKINRLQLHKICLSPDFFFFYSSCIHNRKKNTATGQKSSTAARRSVWKKVKITRGGGGAELSNKQLKMWKHVLFAAS